MVLAFSVDEELEIPPEIWLLVLDYLEPHDLRECRLVSRSLEPLAASLFFKTLVFQFSRRSVDNLAQIAANKRLAGYVRTLVLWRGPKLGLRSFKSFEEWEECLIWPNEQDTSDDSYSSDGSSNDSKESAWMSERDWSELTHTQKSGLYRDYNKERKMTPDVRGYLINGVKDAVEKLIKLSKIIHDPVVRGESQWTEQWKQLRFDHWINLPFSDSWEKEHDVDALHFACLLLALGRIEEHLTHLKSLTFYVEGPAFWGPNRLRQLFQEYDHRKIRQLRESIIDATQADVIADGDFDGSMGLNDEVARLVSMGKIVRHLTHIDCYVSDEDNNGSLLTIAKPLFAILCDGANLEQVSLAFGDFADQDTESYDSLIYYHDTRPGLLPALARRKPWPKVTKLKLSIATNLSTLLEFLDSLAPTLRHLILEEVTLLPSEDEKALWEIALPSIASSLQGLQQLELSFLQDFPSQEQGPDARKLLNPFVDAWQGRRDCYDHHIHIVTNDLMRTQELQHPLESDAFMEQHNWICEHVIQLTS